MNDGSEDAPNLTQMPSTLGDPEPAPGEGEGEGDAPSVEDQVAELQRRIEAGQERQEALEQLYTSTITQLAGASSGQQAPTVSEQPSFDDLPDPVEKPEEFRTALSERLNQTIQQHSQQQSQQLATQQQRAQQLDGLMTKFSQQYPDLATREALLSGATQQEANVLRQRGVKDVEAAVLADSEGFLKRVADRMRKELGTTDTTPEGGKEGKPNRTQGVSGGSKGAAGAGAGGEGKKTSFSDQLKQTQLESGLI